MDEPISPDRSPAAIDLKSFADRNTSRDTLVHFDADPLRSTAESSQNHRRQRRPIFALIALVLLFLAASAGVAFSVLAVVFDFGTDGDIPGRILVFAASVSSLIYCVLHAVSARTRFTVAASRKISLWLYRSSIQTSALILSRLDLVAWIAAAVVTSLLIARSGVSFSAGLAERAIYLNLIISSAALVASFTISLCIESSRTPFKTAAISSKPFLSSENAIDEDRKEHGDKLGRLGVSQRPSVDEQREDSENATNTASIPEFQPLKSHPISNPSWPVSKYVTRSARRNSRSAGSRGTPDTTQKDNKRKLRSEVKPTRTVPMSPAVTRPASVIPPVPTVVVQTVNAPIATRKTTARFPSVRRKPVGGGGSIKRKPVPRAPMTLDSIDELPKSLPLATQDNQIPDQDKSFPVSTDTSEPSSPTSIYSFVRKSSASFTSSEQPLRSLGEMAASLRDSSYAALVFPPPTRTVTFANPLLMELPVTRVSLMASGGDSRYPSMGSVKETVHSLINDRVNSLSANSQLNINAIEPVRRGSVAAAPALPQIIENSPAEADARRAGVVLSEETMASDSSEATNKAALGTTVAYEPDDSLAVLHTDRHMHKVALAAKAFPATSTARRRPITGYNFSRPLRPVAAAGGSSSSNNSNNSSGTAGPSVADQRARIRGQLLEMLPVQHQPQPSVLTARQHRHKRSISLDMSTVPRRQSRNSLAPNKDEDDEDGDWEDYDGGEMDTDSRRDNAQRRAARRRTGSRRDSTRRSTLLAPGGRRLSRPRLLTERNM